jgi:hypothetical protein
MFSLITGLATIPEFPGLAREPLRRDKRDTERERTSYTTCLFERQWRENVVVDENRRLKKIRSLPVRSLAESSESARRRTPEWAIV